MTKEELGALADSFAAQAAAAGCYGAIIALSHEHPIGHSSFAIRSRGRCLELEGLAARVAWWAQRIWDYKAWVAAPGDGSAAGAAQFIPPLGQRGGAGGGRDDFVATRDTMSTGGRGKGGAG